MTVTRSVIERAKRIYAEQLQAAEAILAEGRSVELETFACFLDWFDKT